MKANEQQLRVLLEAHSTLLDLIEDRTPFGGDYQNPIERAFLKEIHDKLDIVISSINYNNQ